MARSAINVLSDKANAAQSLERIKELRGRLIEKLNASSSMTPKTKRLALGLFHDRIRARVKTLRLQENAPVDWEEISRAEKAYFSHPAMREEEDSLPVNRDNPPRGLPMSCAPEVEEQTMDNQPRPMSARPHRSEPVT